MNTGYVGKKKTIRFIDLFAGIGGFRYAMQNAGADLGADVECVFSSEIDQECQRAYAANFGETPHGDITEIAAQDIPDHDVLLAGFPCQPFSIIGHRRGFDDTRGTLFFDIARILAEKKPTAFVLENVKLLVGHSKGQTLNRILETLDELGYYATYKVLNALDFGLPQKRERVFIVGFRSPRYFNWPSGNIPMRPLSEILEDEVPEEYFASGYIRKKRLSKQKPTKEPTIWHENKAGHISAYPFSCALRAGASYNYLLVNGERRLTLREMLRLQGFPEEARIVCNYSQSRKQAGNSLPVPVAQAVIKNLIQATDWVSTFSQEETDKLVVDDQLRIFENTSEYDQISETANSPKIQATVSAQ